MNMDLQILKELTNISQLAWSFKDWSKTKPTAFKYVLQVFKTNTIGSLATDTSTVIKDHTKGCKILMGRLELKFLTSNRDF